MAQESAPFKFTHEMTQLLDPSGQKTSREYARFEALCIRGYLAVSERPARPAAPPAPAPPRILPMTAA